MGELISYREFGRRVGVNLRSIQFALEQGRLSIAERKPYGKKMRPYLDWEKSEKAWHKNRGDTNKRTKLTKGERAAGVTVPGDPGQTHDTSHPGKKKSGKKEPEKQSQFQTARSVRETYNAKMAELNFRKAAGNMVPTAEVKRLFFEIGRVAQQNLLNIPARVSAVIAAEVDEKKVHDMLTNEIIKALDGIANADLARIGD